MDTYENVEEVVIEIYNADNKERYYKKMDFLPTGDIYNLDRIYSNDSVNLQYAFDMIDSDPSITDDFDTIDVNILYR